MKVYLYDSETEYDFDDMINDDDTDLETAIEEFYELSEEEGSFLGIITPDNRIIQFAYVDNNKWILDIPSKDNPQDFYQREVTYDACVQIIKSVFSGTSIDEIKGP